MSDLFRKWGWRLLALATLVMTVGYIFNWRGQSVLYDQGGVAALAWAGVAVCFAWVGPSRVVEWGRRIERIPGVVFGAAAVVGVGLLCGVIATGPYEGVPRVQDEVNYFFQAKIFAGGKLWVPSHDLAEFFTVRFFVNDGRMYSLFQPGWPALLAVGHLVGAPALVAPVLSAASTGFFFGAARRILGEVAGRWATVMLACTAVFIFQGASMMAHTAAAMCAIGMLYFAARYWEERRAGFAVIAAGLLGMLFTVRAGTAVGLGAPVGVAMVYLWWRGELDKRVFGWAALGFVPVAGLQFWHNWMMSGELLSFAQDRYFELTEPVASCHRLGIGEGIGCPREHGPDLGADGFTWTRAAEVTRIRLEQFRWDLFGTGLGAFLVWLPFLAGREGRYRWLLAGILAGLVGLYFFYYYHGNCYGARYYFEAVPAGVMLIVGGWRGVYDAVSGWSAPRALGRRLAGGAVLAAAVFFPIFSVVVEFPTLWERYGPGYWGVDRSVINTVEEAELENAVVILANRSDKHYRIGFFLNEPTLDTEVLYVRDYGRQNEQLKAYYPERKFYEFYRTGLGEGRLREIRLRSRRDRIFLEGESKFPPLRRASAYAMVQDLRQFGWRRASEREQLFVDSQAKHAWVEFEQYVFEQGAYRVSGSWGTGPDYGVATVSVAGQVLEPGFDGYREQVRTESWRARGVVKLEAGLQTIRVQISAKNPASRGYKAGLDYLVLERVEE